MLTASPKDTRAGKAEVRVAGMTKAQLSAAA